MSHKKPPRQASQELQAEKARLNKLKVTELKQQCKTAGLTKCYRKLKVDLVRELAKVRVPRDKQFIQPAQDDELAQMTVKKLQVKCQELGIPKCYKYRPKAELVKMLHNHLKPRLSKTIPANTFIDIPVPKSVRLRLDKLDTLPKPRQTLAVPLQLDKFDEQDFAPIDLATLQKNQYIPTGYEDFPPIDLEELPSFDDESVRADVALQGQYGSTWTFLGEGTFGQVYKAFDSKTNTTVVLKKLDKTKVDKEQLASEIHILQVLQKHCRPYFVCYIESVETETDWYIVMEFLGDYIVLDQYIADIQTGARSADWNMTKTIIKNILQAMQILFATYAVNHRDIKPENIMVNVSDKHKGAGAIKVIDFGSSCHKEKCTGEDVAGTPAFLAPELAVALLSADQKSPFTSISIHHADLWSLGITIWELITGVSFVTAFEQTVDSKTISATLQQYNLSQAYFEAEIGYLYELVYMTLIPADRLKDIMNKVWYKHASKSMPPELYSQLRRIFLSLTEQQPSKRKLIQL